MSARSPALVARLGLLAAAASILFILESLAPRPLPWMRLGLGNLPVLIALLAYGPGPALSVSMVKLFLGIIELTAVVAADYKVAYFFSTIVFQHFAQDKKIAE